LFENASDSNQRSQAILDFSSATIEANSISLKMKNVQIILSQYGKIFQNLNWLSLESQKILNFLEVLRRGLDDSKQNLVAIKNDEEDCYILSLQDQKHYESASATNFSNIDTYGLENKGVLSGFDSSYDPYVVHNDQYEVGNFSLPKNEQSVASVEEKQQRIDSIISSEEKTAEKLKSDLKEASESMVRALANLDDINNFKNWKF